VSVGSNESERNRQENGFGRSSGRSDRSMPKTDSSEPEPECTNLKFQNEIAEILIDYMF
jgi:hypothetical protein